MKKFVRFFSLLLVVLMLAPAMATAQQMPQIPPMGVDPEVRIGTLPNGLTYYIRHNDYPKGQAEFYIAQKVGSILEEDDQRGLAHFLEHMCFNGTTHFPGNSLVKYLESIGVKFGAHLNAYTAVDQTVYNISKVPTAREGSQDSCLLILHDWANDLLLEPAEIDAERAVIHEEWRSRSDGQSRILEQLLPKIYPNSKYGQRMPIGTMEVVDNFPYQALRDYYEKWYRPDQQGIIVVGDINVDRIEGKIKEMFSDIEMPVEVAERVYLPVDDTEGTIYAIGHDKEQTRSLAQLMIKSDVMPREQKGTMLYYVENYIQEMISSMLNTRLNDISSKPNAPFAASGVYFDNFFLAKTKDAMTLGVIAKDSAELPSGVAAAYRELLRAAQSGFTVTEFERTKAEYLSSAETVYNNRNKRENASFVASYVNNFLDNTPIPTAEESYETKKQVAAMIPLEAINATVKELVTPDNRVLLAFLPDAADGVYPTEKEFADALASVDGETIEAYKEEVKAEPLIPNLPKPGKIKKETTLSQWDATEWTLSNGVKVIVKPTKFKDNEVFFSAIAVNGTAADKTVSAQNIKFLPYALGQYGLGSYSNSDLQKYLSGKQAMLNFGMSSYNRMVSGYSTPGTNVTYVMTDAQQSLTSRSSDDMVHFVVFADTASVARADSLVNNSMSLFLNANLGISEGSTINVDLSTDGKNKVSIQGAGNLSYSLTPLNGDGRMTGRFTINSGFVRYTPSINTGGVNMSIMSEKNFTFREGSYVAFNGDILNPSLNVTATDRIKANVTQEGQNSRLVNFDVILSITNTLQNLNVAFNLSTDDDITIENELASMSPEQRANQAMNLLLYNQYTGPGTKASANLSGNPLYSFLASQLNTWAANNIRGVDISFGIDQYDTTTDGSKSTTTSYSYRVSKSLFDDRFKIVIGGNYSTDANADENFSQNLINDISFEYMLNRSGSIYVRLFRHVGYESILEGEITQTGVGFVMKRKLNSLRDLFRFRKRSPKPTDISKTPKAPVNETDSIK